MQNVDKNLSSGDQFKFITVTQNIADNVYKQFLVLLKQVPAIQNCLNMKELCLWPQCHKVVTLSKEESFNNLMRNTARNQQIRTNNKQSNA